MNSYSTEFLARDHIAEMHREADDEHRASRPHRGRPPHRPDLRLVIRVGSLRRGARPVASLELALGVLTTTGKDMPHVAESSIAYDRGHARRLVSPITIGRATELEAATRSLDAALDGHPSHLLVTGKAGSARAAT